MVTNEDRFRALQEKQAEFEARLEANALEQNIKIAAGLQSLEDSFQELKAHMVSWKDEIMELLRLNRPPPPTMDQPSVHGQSQPQQPSPGEGSVDPGRRHSKEPVVEDQVEVEEVSNADAGQDENHFDPNVNSRDAGRHWMARRVHFGARQGQNNQGGDQMMRSTTSAISTATVLLIHRRCEFQCSQRLRTEASRHFHRLRLFRSADMKLGTA